ncbi:unnamed protein product [Adineta steineri]|uniref:F-box domain-containing protein n=1 Tax=Adineta steineri TaxID=433720 RepID=A0A819R2G8_9BILA|nr:unnamed protein product [Adineta steineri]
MSSSQIKLSKFELIPNEVLLEIFEYLSPYDIFQAFYYLNSRYNDLLISLHVRINLLNKYKKIFDYYNYFLFPLVPYNIISFRCEDICDRLIYQIRLSEFISLKYLTIFNLNIETLQIIIPQLSKLEKLIYLNLQTKNNINIENEIIFQRQLPLIQTCILNLNKKISFQNEHFYPNLKDLILNQCNIEDLGLFIQNYTPQLQHLTVTLIDGKIPEEIDKIHHLKSLIINSHTIPFHRLTNSIFNLFRDLQRLSINATGIEYTNGKQWQALLSSTFPQLNCFQLHIIFPQEDVPTSDDRIQLLKTFETLYFRQRKWYFAFIYCPSMTNIEFFSLPIINKKIDVNLYNTSIETTMNDEHTFKNIKELSLVLTDPNETSSPLFNSCFFNVENLKLISEFREYQPFPKNLYVDISRLVKFSHIKSMELIGMHFPSTILILLDYMPNLHSITITLNHLNKMTKTLTDNKICQHLTKLIKHLTIT